MKRCLKNKRAVCNALKAIIRKYHLQIDHLLMDNGWENILLDQVDPNINLYHCDPPSPWQKSNVERTGFKNLSFVSKASSVRSSWSKRS